MSLTNFNDTTSVVVLARVEGDRVVEYPVTAEQVASRDHSRAMYYQVKVENDVFSDEAGLAVKTEVKVDHGLSLVTIRHYVVSRTLEECLLFFRAALVKSGWRPKLINEVPVGEIDHFEKQLGLHLESKLEAMAKERYSSLDTLLGRYSNSTNPVWKKEAQYAQSLLDQTWKDLIDYFASIRDGSRPLPVTLEEAEAPFSKYSWSDMPS